MPQHVQILIFIETITHTLHFITSYPTLNLLLQLNHQQPKSLSTLTHNTNKNKKKNYR